ncbi:aryl-sulfate sulfotransferase [Salinicoccus roseus]|uniref:Aryl-sulfate sulfotransferase n=1 Tax=Salinicoccus roseus TaxID=45670 RepID=A0A0C2E946_9STAP|nr:aryl-sulfate sulfotransferase [Salinicoccus roseus]KIH71787.1 arylsulfate sulfotransferase [Salinicoccus roseus]MDB0579867.1 aryl-sulfate sulfotransferase [Salinicoccus roseus]
MKRTNILIIAIIGLFAVLVMILTLSNDDQKKRESQEAPNTAEGVDYNYPPERADALLQEQERLESDLLAESSGGTLEDPYVNLDPYGRSPLSALVIFDTETRSQVSFTVQGKDSETDISTTIDGYGTHHEIPIVGLYPSYTNTVEIAVETESGETMTNTLTIVTERLPSGIPAIKIKEAKPEKMQLAENELTFYVPSTRHAFAFDINGDVRWYGAGFNSHVLQELDNGNLLYLSKDDNSGNTYNRLFEIDYIGKLYNAFEISEEAAEQEAEDLESTLIHHDVAELPSGNLLMTVNDGGGEYMEDMMIEADRQTGKVVKVIDLKDLFPSEVYEEYPVRDDFGLRDWFHQNSVVYDESDDSIIISGRHQDAVMKIDYETEEIIWILAHPEGWNEEMSEHLIEGEGKDFKYPAAQHDATVLPDFDDNPATIDVLLFDNNTVVTRGDEAVSGDYSAATHYRIDEETMDAEVVWTYGKELGKDYFTSIISSARYLEDSGNILIDFGHVDEGERSAFMEVTHDAQAERVFEAEMTRFRAGAWAYRAVRYQLYNDSWEERFTLEK